MFRLCTGASLRGARRASVYCSVAIVVALTAIGCSNSPPRLEQIELHVVHHFNAQGVPQPPRLTVFADVSDLDGEGEIAALELRSTDLPVRWQLEGDALQPRRRDGQSWYGSADLLLPGGLVPDTVVIEVTDLSGRSDTRRIAIPPYDPRENPPRFSEAAVSLPEAVSSTARRFGDGAVEPAPPAPAASDGTIALSLQPDPTREYWIVAVVSERHWLAIGPVTPAP